jgi:ElaB/YqjD/DUF883 family membrane-anchored ribosome-binding protein
MKTRHHDIHEDLTRVHDEAHALMDATAHATEDAVIEARNRIQAALDATRETCAKVKVKAVAGAKATDKVIHENPYKSMGVALGVGAVVGFLLSRRFRN